MRSTWAIGKRNASETACLDANRNGFDWSVLRSSSVKIVPSVMIRKSETTRLRTVSSVRNRFRKMFLNTSFANFIYVHLSESGLFGFPGLEAFTHFGGKGFKERPGYCNNGYEGALVTLSSPNPDLTCDNHGLISRSNAKSRNRQQSRKIFKVQRVFCVVFKCSMELTTTQGARQNSVTPEIETDLTTKARRHEYD